MKKVVIIEIICFLFILLFMYAAITKLMDYDKFRTQIGQSPLLTPFASWMAWAVPGVEIIISILLSFQRSRLIALYASFSLMTIFTAYIIAILNFASYVPCSCGGILEKLGWTEHIFFNVGFIILSIVGIALHYKQSNQQPSVILSHDQY